MKEKKYLSPQSILGLFFAKVRGVKIIFGVLGLIFVSWLFAMYFIQGNRMATYPLYSDPPTSISVLSANVGNLDLRCRNVLSKLCYVEVEERIAANIQQLKPDLVVLQEVLAPWQCEKIQETNAKKVCAYRQDVPQARRLLGDSYTIICNTRNEFECIGLRKDVGNIVGCLSGAYCVNARTGLEVTGCDNGFTVSAATLELFNGAKFDVVNLHPQSTSASCRAKMIERIFAGPEGHLPLLQEEKVLIIGDFNFDPWRDEDESVEVWKTYLELGWMGHAFQYHSGLVEADPPRYTSLLFFKKRTLDFAVSNFLSGTLVVLGETPGTARLDGGKGADHRALYGVLSIK